MSTSKEQIKNEIDNINSQLTKSQVIQDFRLYGAIATSIDNLIPDQSKGLDKIGKISLKNTLNIIDKNFYSQLFGKVDSSNANKISRVGVLKLLDILNRVDICVILSPNITGNKVNFNPNANPVPVDPVWKIKKLAFDIKQAISLYNYTNSNISNIASRRQNTQSLIALLVNQLQTLGSANYLAQANFKQQYPSSTIALNTTNELSQYFLREGNNPDFLQDEQKISSKLNKISIACDTIISLGSPEQISKLSDKLLPDQITESIRELEKILTPGENAINKIKQLTDSLSIIQRVCFMILNTLSLLQIVITIIKVVVKVLRLIAQFLGILPIPGIFTIVGIPVTISKLEKFLTEKGTQFITQLQNISNVLTIISINIESILALLDIVIPKLDSLIEQIESCQRTDDSYNELTLESNSAGELYNGEIERTILANLKSTVAQLKVSQNDLRIFVTNYENNKQQSQKQYGDYTIEILEEQLVDEGISIKRRFGVALDRNLIEIVKTEPTFASDDNIIIEEVKLKIRALKQPTVSQGFKQKDFTNISPQEIQQLADIQQGLFSIEEQNIINEASNWLYDDSVSIDDVKIDTNLNTYLDDPNNEDDNSGLGLNAFVNKLKGGKKLREKTRAIMQEEKTKLNKETQKVR